MRPDAEYLKSISHPSKEFDATRFVNDYLMHELQQLRHASIFSSMHLYVTQCGYPIPPPALTQTSYLNRVGLEDTLSRNISAAHNIYLVGCEGSGKTTLLHYVISSQFDKFKSIFSYVDVSDIGTSVTGLSEVCFDKMRNSLFLALPNALKDKFRAWITGFDADPFARDLVNTSNTKRFVEALLIFLNSEPSPDSVYLIIDNVDSLKSKIVEELFALLRLLEETVMSAFKTISIKNNDRIRFIICCRTQSIDVVTSVSRGLFTRSPFSTIDMEERFLKETDLLKLTKSFIQKEGAYIFKGRPRAPIHVPAHFGSIGWESFEDYAEDVFNWLALSRNEVNNTISKFCGRSIRRAKLFLVKALASPVIARLVFFEKHKIYNITRSDPDYLARRMLEALFDFSTSTALHLRGYPLNPFGVLRANRTFRDNPLIGVVTLLYISEHLDSLRQNQIHFAQAINVREVVEHLERMRYDREAIVECFQSFVLSGLMRPISGARAVLEDTGADERISECYVLDDQALTTYMDLLLFKKWYRSLTFYNMALRSRYGIRSDRHLDNMTYEAYTFLVFLFDLLEREQRLEVQLKGTGVMFRPLSARIRHVVFAILQGELEKGSANGVNRSMTAAVRATVRKEQEDLVKRTQDMMGEARWKLSRQAAIM